MAPSSTLTRHLPKRLCCGMLPMEALLLAAATTLLLVLSGIPCASSDEASFGLTYKGGKLMTEPVTVSLLWFGPGFQESGMEAVRNGISSLSPSRYLSTDSDVPTLGDWWDIVRQYKDGANAPVSDTVEIGNECFYTGPHSDVSLSQVIGVSQSVFNNTLAIGLGNNLTCNQAFEVKESSIYMILFSKDVIFEMEATMSTSCSGSLQVEALAAANVSVEWARAPRAVHDQCSMYLTGDSYIGPPNGDPSMDVMSGFALGKIAERAINPDGRGWTNSGEDPLTISSYCDLQVEHAPDVPPPLYRDVRMNVSFNAVGLNGYRYIVQYIWDQSIKNCALKLSNSCSTAPVLLEQPKGHLMGGLGVNYTDGLQPIAPNQRCRWSINHPEAKFISFTVNYLSRATNSDYSVLVCSLKSGSRPCTELQGDLEGSEKRFKLMGSKASIIFTSSDLVSIASRGWELSYSTGLCDGKEDLYHRHGTIGYTPNSGFSYVEGLNCQWILHGNPGIPVSINFSQINISKGLDFLGIYDIAGHQIANFSGYYNGSDLPKLILTGTVRIVFETQTDGGDGWQAVYHIASPVKNHEKVVLVVVASIAAAASVIIALRFIAFALSKRRRKRKNQLADKGPMLVGLETVRKENQIGEGPSAIVYRAALADGGLVAVKCRKDATSQTRLEEEILLRIGSHQNIVSLVGYIQDGPERQNLAFEYVCGENLSINLKLRGESLDWPKRLDIALQICSGIQKLHMYTKPPVYHGNIASENILLDECSNAKLCGFKSANYCSNNRMNPENLSEMFEDIWSFGIVLVELLTGEHVENKDSCNFKSFDEVNDFVGGRERLDRRLDTPRDQWKIMALAKLGDIAKWCIACSRSVGGSKCNPKIGDLFSSLEQVKEMFCTA